MAIETTRGVLDQVRDFHRRLGKFYAEMANSAGKEKVKALLAYMSRHEENIERIIAKYEEDAAKDILDHWFEFTPDIAKCACFNGIDLTPEMSVDDVIQKALWYDSCLVEFYGGMAALSVTTNLQDLFQSLAEMEEHKKRKAMRAALELDQG